MAKKTFQLKKGDIRNMRQFYRDFPTVVQFAKIGTINNLAFRTRGNTLEELGKNMMIRSPGFVKGSVRYKKATRGDPVAETGSIRRERFSGWIEQETGKKTGRKRVQTVTARSRNWRRRVAPRFRLKPSAKFIRPADVKLNRTQIVPFLQILDRRRYRQPFLIPTRYKRLQRGIYIFLAKKIKRIQNFDPKNVQPKRDAWMSRAVGQINQSVTTEEYHRALKFSIQKNAMLKRYRR